MISTTQELSGNGRRCEAKGTCTDESRKGDTSVAQSELWGRCLTVSQPSYEILACYGRRCAEAVRNVT
jgi:hypothetical protein